MTILEKKLKRNLILLLVLLVIGFLMLVSERFFFAKKNLSDKRSIIREIYNKTVVRSDSDNSCEEFKCKVLLIKDVILKFDASWDFIRKFLDKIKISQKCNELFIEKIKIEDNIVLIFLNSINKVPEDKINKNFNKAIGKIEELRQKQIEKNLLKTRKIEVKIREKERKKVDEKHQTEKRKKKLKINFKDENSFIVVN